MHLALALIHYDYPFLDTPAYVHRVHLRKTIQSPNFSSLFSSFSHLTKQQGGMDESKMLATFLSSHKLYGMKANSHKRLRIREEKRCWLEHLLELNGEDQIQIQAI
jgi:hypothetical protein